MVPVSRLAQSVPIHADPEARRFSKEKTPPLVHNNSHVSKYFIIGTGRQYFLLKNIPPPDLHASAPMLVYESRYRYRTDTDSIRSLSYRYRQMVLDLIFFICFFIRYRYRDTHNPYRYKPVRRQDVF
jgi:hypothetical protein